MKSYFGKFAGQKTYHVINAESVDDARKKMLKGTRFKASEVIIKTKMPKTKYPIAGRASIL